jgi:hypothetical protein
MRWLNLWSPPRQKARPFDRTPYGELSRWLFPADPPRAIVDIVHGTVDGHEYRYFAVRHFHVFRQDPRVVPFSPTDTLEGLEEIPCVGTLRGGSLREFVATRQVNNDLGIEDDLWNDDLLDLAFDELGPGWYAQYLYDRVYLVEGMRMFTSLENNTKLGEESEFAYEQHRREYAAWRPPQGPA